MKKAGFSLIEIIVVVTMLVMILAGVVGAMTSIFRAQTMVNLNNKIVKNGNWSMDEIKKNILNANGADILCSNGIGATGISFNNIMDGDSTTLICYDNKIASESAREKVDLTSINEVRVINCNNFVKCNYNSSSVVSVEFNFVLETGTTEPNYAKKGFSSTISIRN